MAVQSIPLGQPTQILQNVVYALPSCASFIMADAGVEVSQSVSGPWTSLTSGTRTAASFIRCLSGNTIITAKSSRSVKSSGGAAQTYAQKVVADGASNYWRLNETSGLTAVDSVGGKNGTISGGVTLNQAGAVAGGKSMLFDGINGQIFVNSPFTLSATCTFEAWFKSTFGGNRSICYGRADQGWDTYFGIGTNGGGPTVVQFLCGSPLIDGTVPIDDGNWHHLVVTNLDTNRKIYVDGVLDRAVVSTSFMGVVDGPSLYIGGNPITGFGKHTLAEIAIYPSALSPAQIAAHYALR